MSSREESSSLSTAKLFLDKLKANLRENRRQALVAFKEGNFAHYHYLNSVAKSIQYEIQIFSRAENGDLPPFL